MNAPSPWIVRWAHLIAPGSSVLDVACGSGRHLRWLAAQGYRVTGVDRNAEALAPLRDLGEIIEADIEDGPWPLAGRRFDAVIVTNYLWRPLLQKLVASVADRGLLLYETFAQGQQRFGKPTHPDHLLRPGELLMTVESLRVVAYEDGVLSDPPRRVQRIAAVRSAADADGSALTASRVGAAAG
jgi:SAM-dependent methyltransferase